MRVGRVGPKPGASAEVVDGLVDHQSASGGFVLRQATIEDDQGAVVSVGGARVDTAPAGTDLGLVESVAPLAKPAELVARRRDNLEGVKERCACLRVR